MFGSNNSDAIRKALAVCKAVADGDFEARVIGISEKGEAGDLLHAINRMIDRTDAYVRESQACLEYVRDNKYYRRIRNLRNLHIDDIIILDIDLSRATCAFDDDNVILFA